MVAHARLPIGADITEKILDTCETLSKYAGNERCREVLLILCRRQLSGGDTTVWDIHRLTNLPLHEAFAVLRTLEHGKVVDILDDPADPFGATIRLRKEAFGELGRRSET